MNKKNFYLESIFDLNSGNIWGLSAHNLSELWQKDMKEEDFADSEEKLINVIRLAFDVYHFNPNDVRESKHYSTDEYFILPSSDKRKPSVAIRKKTIRRLTDLSYENVRHITEEDLLRLIDDNFGGGWDSIPLSVKDIIESTFDVSTTTLPSSRLHVKGGTLDKKKNDGYEVLEIQKGTWIEAIFVKKREPMERIRFVSDNDYMNEDDLMNEGSSDEGGVEALSDDETFYESYTPEADIKEDEEDLSDE